MNDYQFIKGFQEIKLSTICRKFNIKACNVTNGQTSDENFRKVKNEIVRELLMLILADKGESLITLALYDEVISKLEKENKMLREMV